MGNKSRFHADIMAMHPEVTGSCILVILKLPNRETLRIVVDCGLFHERKYDDMNETLPFNPKTIDYCFVTHNHVDHIGRLPFMVKNGYCNKIYATEDTCKLMPLALEDSIKVLQTNAKRKNKKCIYRNQDVSNTLRLLEPCNFEETMTLGRYVKATFFINGHLPGAALILLQFSYPGEEDINILFTGDYNDHNNFFDVPPLPDWVLKLPLIIVTESTYGHKNSDEVEPCFKENLLKAINANHTVIVPVFSLGRSQLILDVLKGLQESGELPLDVPVYLDGKLAYRYTEMYIDGDLNIKEEKRAFLPENFSFITDSSRQSIVRSKKRKIVLTTSGMGSHGPAPVHIYGNISRENATIHFAGYTAEGTLGRKLQNGEKGQIIDVGVMVKKMADVYYTSEFSSHAPADVLLKVIQAPEDVRLVLINHGNIGVQEKLAERILNESEAKKVGLLGRDYFFRVDHYGLVKTLCTNF